MRRVDIRTPARLHFGLVADGRGERKFGGVGMAIDKPGFELSVQFDERDHINSWIDSSLQARIKRLLARLRERWDVPPVRIDVEKFIPHHIGLGSGTQLALAIGEAVARLLRSPIPRDELAAFLGRGRRSAIGFHAFHEGGFLIDRGKTADLPIAAVEWHRFPEDWRIVLLHPPLPPGVHGAAEYEAFRDRIAIPAAAAERLRNIALSELAPALEDRDYLRFGETLYTFNRLAGECFASVQGGPYAHPRLEEIVADARRLGCPAVGQSSWGPTLFAIHSSQARAEAFIDQITELHPDVETTLGTSGFQTGVDSPGVAAVFGTQLMVSVRSPAEAVEALAGGIDVLDIKEPTRGPLGCAEPAIRNAVLDLMVPFNHRRQWHPSCIWRSSALGELTEAEAMLQGQEANDHDASSEISYFFRLLAKIGFAGERRRPDWAERFLALSERRIAHRNWSATFTYIPAAYADDENADAPNWRDIVDRVCKKRPQWGYLLVDTFDKRANFWDALSGAGGVRELFNVCKKEKIHLALAGSLQADDIDRLADELGQLPNIIAVRGAACKDGIRTNPIDRGRVASLLRRLIAAEVRFDGRSPPRCRG